MTDLDDKVFPRRNLGPSEYWGRTVERRIEDTEKHWGMVGQRVDGTDRAHAASFEDMARRLADMQEASASIPVIKTVSSSRSNFPTGAGWNTILSHHLAVPEGKRVCSVLGWGSVHVDAATGGVSTPGFIWPFDLSLVTSEYGPRNGRFHEGIDFAGGAASAGNPIPCSAAGTVVTATFSSGFGNYVIVYHGVSTTGAFDLYTLYAHMSSISVTVGASVTQGQTLGLVGNTGNSFGAHLHFETHLVPGGPIVWDNYNPTYASNRTAYNPRTFMATYGGAGTPSVDSDVLTRIVIEGSSSLGFRPFKDLFDSGSLPCTFFPVYGRNLAVDASQIVDVALQVWTTAGLPSYSVNSAVLNVQGIFS